MGKIIFSSIRERLSRVMRFGGAKRAKTVYTGLGNRPAYNEFSEQMTGDMSDETKYEPLKKEGDEDKRDI